MTKMYIANCTKFVQDFLYKLPQQPQNNAYRVNIPMGGQALIERNEVEIKHIIDQHQKYGLKHISELDRTQGYIGLCYQFDRPIDVEKIMSGVKHFEEQQERNSHEQRKIMAASVANAVSANTAESLQSIEVEVTEQQKDQTDHSEKMVETIQVAKPGSKAAQRGAARAAQNR